MADPEQNLLDGDNGKDLPKSVVARMAGAGVPLLPGESLTDYQLGLTRTIEELGASTHLQVYLAEKSSIVFGG